MGSRITLTATSRVTVTGVEVPLQAGILGDSVWLESTAIDTVPKKQKGPALEEPRVPGKRDVWADFLSPWLG